MYSISAELRKNHKDVMTQLDFKKKLFLPIMTRNSFAESIGFIHSRAVNKNRMKEDGVT